MKLLLSLLVMLLSLSACATHGSLKYERSTTLPDGTPSVQRVEVTTPGDPAKPGSLVVGPEGQLSVSTGNAATVSSSAKSLARLPLIGAGLLLAGVLSLVLKAKLPFLPLELGIGLIGTGLLLIVLPSIIEAYLGYILLGLVGTAVVVTAYRFNKVQQRVKQLDPKDPTPDE